MAEWLGNALQKHLQRFESARNLNKKPHPSADGWGFLVSVSIYRIKLNAPFLKYSTPSCPKALMI